MNRTTKTQLRAKVESLQKQGIDIDIHWAYGQPYCTTKDQGQDLSPRPAYGPDVGLATWVRLWNAGGEARNIARMYCGGIHASSFQQFATTFVIGETRHEIRESHKSSHQKASARGQEKTAEEDQRGFSYRACRGLAGRSAHAELRARRSSHHYVLAIFNAALLTSPVGANTLTCKQTAHITLAYRSAIRAGNTMWERQFCVGGTLHGNRVIKTGHDALDSGRLPVFLLGYPFGNCFTAGVHSNRKREHKVGAVAVQISENISVELNLALPSPKIKRTAEKYFFTGREGRASQVCFGFVRWACWAPEMSHAQRFEKQRNGFALLFFAGKHFVLLPANQAGFRLTQDNYAKWTNTCQVNNHVYVPYWMRGKRFQRTWCVSCGNNDRIVEAEYPDKSSSTEGIRERMRGVTP